jgi:hypothetical protein
MGRFWGRSRGLLRDRSVLNVGIEAGRRAVHSPAGMMSVAVERPGVNSQGS